MVYNAEEMMGDDNEGMVAIGMVEEEGEHEQVLLIANISGLMDLEKLITGRVLFNQIWIRELCNVPDNFFK